MAETKALKVGSVVRLTSFANKPADGSEPKGFAASPEDTPEEERKVFLCMVLAIEPQLLKNPEEDHEQKVIERALNGLGYYKAYVGLDMAAIPSKPS